jgi:hypothetical protein
LYGKNAFAFLIFINCSASVALARWLQNDYGKPDAIANAIGYAKFFSRSHDAVIRVYDGAGNVIETHEQAGDFKEW